MRTDRRSPKDTCGRFREEGSKGGYGCVMIDQIWGGLEVYKVISLMRKNKLGGQE